MDTEGSASTGEAKLADTTASLPVSDNRIRDGIPALIFGAKKMQVQKKAINHLSFKIYHNERRIYAFFIPNVLQVSRSDERTNKSTNVSR